VAGVETFAALADPTRRQIVELLSSAGELPAGRIAESFPSMTRAAVSRHLRLLEDAGLLAVRPAAQQRLYRVDPAPLAELDDWLDRYRPMWTRSVASLKRHLEET
jgi:DNA-binding transcriptional ArsR family regulator